MMYNLDRINELIEEIKKSKDLKFIKSKLLDIRNYLDDEINLVNTNLERKKENEFNNRR